MAENLLESVPYLLFHGINYDTTKGVGVGTGLGLAISQKIIEKHNGKITVKTKLNEGSEFTITIPSK